MAFIRCTNSTYGVYEKFKDPATGKQRERCLVRLGPYQTAWQAYSGYRAEIAHAWWRMRQTDHQCGQWARHEYMLAQGVVERLAPKLQAVAEYLQEATGKPYRGPRWIVSDDGDYHPRFAKGAGQ